MKAVVALALVAGCLELEPTPSQVLGALPAVVPAPVDNPTTPEAVALGRKLFFDPILSGDRDVACATCHHPDFAYADGIAVSVGVGATGIGPAREVSTTAPRTARNAQTVLATAWNGLSVDGAVAPEAAPMFWDHRVQALEGQALEPIKSQIEMRGSAFTEEEILDVVVARLADDATYVTEFAAAYGVEGVSTVTLAKAIAAFERTLVPVNSSFDRYMAGDDSAMSAPAIRGLRGFIDAGCARCHSGPLLSDFKLHRIEVPSLPGAEPDLGDGEGRFRTPSLRMVSRTAPYMHNGSLATLHDVFDHYHNIPVTDPLLEGDVEIPLGSTDDMLLFFESLSDGTFPTDGDRILPSN